LIALIRRGDFTFVPRAGTVIGEDDRLTIIGEPEGIQKLQQQYG